MKYIILFVALFAVALAAPPHSEVASIVRQDADVGPESFNYGYETSDGSKAQASGQLKNIGSENEAISVSGSYSWVADDGQTYSVTYIADENGFQPQGAHLPVA